jgi:hypothetical protein
VASIARLSPERYVLFGQETKKKIAQRAGEILNEDPAVRWERIRRMHAEIVARHEIRAEEAQKQREQP